MVLLIRFVIIAVIIYLIYRVIGAVFDQKRKLDDAYDT